jgi:hypothetical protein
MGQLYGKFGKDRISPLLTFLGMWPNNIDGNAAKQY